MYGMLRAADVAKYFGKKNVTVVEFGIASGAGILNMVTLAPAIENETGVSLRIVGFDSGGGLPTIQGYKDHPELWNPGDFSTGDRDGLARQLKGRAEIIWGNVADTARPFIDNLDPIAPLGFIAVDLDLYSSTKAALTCLGGSPEKYNPAVSMYFDDVRFYFASEWSGELAAIREFNDEHELRKISPDRSLPGQRPAKVESWYAAMYVYHVFDHEHRQIPRERNPLAIPDHAEFMASRHLF
jgi:hypothetical protein